MVKKIYFLVTLTGLFIFVINIFALQLPLILVDRGYSFTRISGLLTLSILLFQLVKVILARISDQLGRKVFFKMATIIIILSNTFPLIQLKYGFLLLAKFLNELGSDLWDMVFLPTVLDNLPKKRVAETYNKWTALPFLLSYCMIILFLLFFRNITFQHTMKLNIGMSLLILLALNWLNIKQKKVSFKKFDIKNLFNVSHGKMKLLMFLNFVIAIKSSATGSFLLLMLFKTVYLFSNNLVMIFTFSFVMLSLLLSLCLAHLVDKYHVKTIIWASLITSFISFALFFCSGNVYLTIPLLIVNSTLVSIIPATKGKIIKKYIGKESAREYSILDMFRMFGFACGFAVAGPIATLFGLKFLFLLRAGLFIIMTLIFSRFRY